MALELRHLRYLLAVADAGGFTRAAEALHVSQPTLSQQVRQMERALGVQLLDRTGRTVRLTDAGEVYAGHARRALRDLAAGQRAVLDVTDLSSGHLRLAVTPTFTAYLVGPLVREFHRRHPGLTLDVREMPQDRMEEALHADALDLGLGFSDPLTPGVACRELFAESLSLVTGPAGRNGGQSARLTPAALAGESLALLSGDHATRVRIDAYFAEHGVRPRVAVEADSVSALVEIVRHTDLATILPDAVTRERPQLARVALDPPLPDRTAALLSREGAYRSAAAGAFTELATDLAPEGP